MITKMKKLTFLVYHKEYEDFLNSLRELGVVHIVEKQQGAAENAELQDNIRLSAPFGRRIEVASEPEASRRMRSLLPMAVVPNVVCRCSMK